MTKGLAKVPAVSLGLGVRSLGTTAMWPSEQDLRLRGEPLLACEHLCPSFSVCWGRS